jgi:hypothetical protein
MQLIEPLFVVLLFVLVRAADLAITSWRASDVARGILYGIVAVLAAIAVVVALLH